MNYDGEIVIGTLVDTSGAEDGIDDLASLLSDGKVFKRIGKDELGNALVEGIKVAITGGSVKMTDALKKPFEELELKKEMNIISEQQYYEELEVLRDNYFSKGSDKWWEYTAKIIEYEQKVVEEQKKNIEKITNEINDKFDDVAAQSDKVIKSSLAEYERSMEALEKSKDKLSNKLSSYGGLYGTAVFDTGEEKSYLENGVWKRDYGKLTLVDIGDLKTEIGVLEKYKQALEGIKNNDIITKEFFESFKSLGLEEGTSLAKNLLSLDEASLKEYMAMWTEKQKISDEIADTVYENEENQIAEDLRAKLKEAFGAVDAEFMSESGKEWASSFGEAFKTKISEMMEQVKSIISQKISDIEYSISLEKEDKGSNTLVYNLYGSGETVAEQLKSARANSELESLRGGY